MTSLRVAVRLDDREIFATTAYWRTCARPLIPTSSGMTGRFCARRTNQMTGWLSLKAFWWLMGLGAEGLEWGSAGSPQGIAESP